MFLNLMRIVDGDIVEIRVEKDAKEENYLIYREYTKKNASLGSFAVQDYFEEHPFCKMVIEIIDLYVKPADRHKGIASFLLDHVRFMNSNAPIILTLAASKKEYPTEPSDDEKIKIAEDLIPFAQANGFTNVNEKFGQYEYKICFLKEFN